VGFSSMVRKNVGEVEAVDDDASVVGEGSGLDDVHAPGGQRAGYVGKEAAAVSRVMTVRSKSWRWGRRSSWTGSSSSLAAIWK